MRREEGSSIVIPIPGTGRDLKLKSAGKVFCFAVALIPAIVTAVRGGAPLEILSWTLFTAIIALPIALWIYRQSHQRTQAHALDD